MLARLAKTSMVIKIYGTEELTLTEEEKSFRLILNILKFNFI